MGKIPVPLFFAQAFLKKLETFPYYIISGELVQYSEIPFSIDLHGNMMYTCRVSARTKPPG